MLIGKNRIIPVIIAFLIAFIHSSSFCQNNQPELTQDLSLTQAILIAFQNNKDIQMQEQEVVVATANILAAKSPFLPQVNAEGSYTRNDKVYSENIFTGYKNDNLANISVTESIYSGGKNMAALRQAQLSLDVQNETLRAKKLDVEFEAKMLYFGLLLAYENERIASETLYQAIKHYENVKQMHKQGTASRFDVLQSGVQVSLLEPNVVKAKNEIDLLKAELNKLLGRKVDYPIQTKEKLVYSFIGIQENEFLKTAYLMRPEMKLKNLGIDIDKWGIQLAKSGYRPTIDFIGNINQRSGNLNNIFEQRQRNWNAGISVNIPIFEGFSTKAKVDAAKAQYLQAKISKDNLADQIAVEIRKACLDLKKSASIIQSQRDNVDEAKEALRISEVSYQNGVAINLDVLDSQVSLAQIQTNLVSGIYDYLMALAYLDRSIGKSVVKPGPVAKEK